MKSTNPYLPYLIGGSVLSAYTLMVMGNLVTSTNSGLACPDWPLCYGTVTPSMEVEIWIEWTHRLLGSLTGLLILASTIMVWKNYRGAPRYMTGAVVALLAAGAALGGVIVLTEAPLLDSVLSVVIISSHLLIATLVLTFLIITFRYVKGPGPGPGAGADTDTKVFALIFGLVYFQVILGIFVRYSGASLACDGFPLCNGLVVPTLSDGLVALHFIHRLTAFALLFTSIWAFIRAQRRAGVGLGRWAFLIALILAQGSFGATIVLIGKFLPVVVLHGATGFFLLGWLAYQAAPFFIHKIGSPEALRSAR